MLALFSKNASVLSMVMSSVSILQQITSKNLPKCVYSSAYNITPSKCTAKCYQSGHYLMVT